MTNINNQSIYSHEEIHAEAGLDADTMGREFDEALCRLEQIEASYGASLQRIASHNFSLRDEIENSQPSSAVAARIIESFAPVELTKVSKVDGLYDFHDEKTAYLGRTLTNRGSGSQEEDLRSLGSIDKIKELVEKEYSTITNQGKNINIVITPATLVLPDAPVDFISSRPDRSEWFGLPTVIYSIPTNFKHHSRLNTNLDSEHLGRSTFSHFESFSSNKAFGRNTEELHRFAEQQKKSTPSEMIRQLKDNSVERSLFKSRPPEQIERMSERGFENGEIKREDFTNPKPIELLDGFHQKLPEWSKIVTHATGATRVNHNEVAVRVWPWDITHVAVSDVDNTMIEKFGSNAQYRALSQAISSAVILSCKRFSLAKELLKKGDQLGLDHPVFKDWMLHQQSYDTKKATAEEKTLSLTEANDRINEMSESERKKRLLDLASKLLEKVSVVSYSADDPDFKLAAGVSEIPLQTFYDAVSLSNEYLNSLTASQMVNITRQNTGPGVLPF